MPKPSEADLLLAAAHELGHAVVGQELGRGLGIHIVKVTVNRRNATGLTTRRLDYNERTMTDEQLRVSIISSAAGWAAEQLWYPHHRKESERPNRANCRTDLEVVARHGKLIDLTEGKALAVATETLRKHWRTVERLAPQLAERGIIRW